MAQPRTGTLISLAALTVAGVVAGCGRASPAVAAPAGGTPLVWVVVAGTDELVEVDLDTRRVAARIRLTGRPHAITSSGDLRQLLVVSPATGTVTLVDGLAGRIDAVFRGLGHPWAAAFGPGARRDGRSRYAYVTDQRRGELIVLDLRRKRVASRVRVGSRPGVLAIGDLLWLTNGTTNPGLTGFDLSKPARPLSVGRIPTDGVPRGIAMQPDTANLYVTYQHSRLVSKVDWGIQPSVTWRHDVGDVVGSLAFDVYSGQRLWLAAPRSGRLLLVSARTGRVLRTVPGCRGAADVTLVGERWVVAACADAGSILVYDTVTRRRVLVPVGLRPVGVAGIVG